MTAIQKCTMKSGYTFQVEYHAMTKEELQDMEREHLGSVYAPIAGMTYEFVEVA